jgi:hypothetical protein
LKKEKKVRFSGTENRTKESDSPISEPVDANVQVASESNKSRRQENRVDAWPYRAPSVPRAQQRILRKREEALKEIDQWYRIYPPPRNREELSELARAAVEDHGEMNLGNMNPFARARAIYASAKKLTKIKVAS